MFQSEKQIIANRENGKKGGRPKGKGGIASHTIQAVEMQKYLVSQALEKKEALIDALIKKATSGDVYALREIFDRMLGRPKQSLDLTTKEKRVLTKEQIDELIRRRKVNPSGKV